MKNLLALDTHRHHLSPLFCIGHQEQLPFTREYVVDQLQALAVQCGWDKDHGMGIVAGGAQQHGQRRLGYQTPKFKH